MIHSDVVIVDLEPDGFAWLSEVVAKRMHSPADEIQILHREGTVVVASHAKSGRLPADHPHAGAGSIVDEPSAVAAIVRRQTGADRVTCLDADLLPDLNHRLNVLAAAHPSQTTFLIEAARLWWNHPAVVTSPDTPPTIAPLLAAQLTDEPGTWWAVFGAWRGDDLHTSLVARCTDGLFDLVTSARHFDSAPPRSDAARLVRDVEQTGAEVRVVALMDASDAEQILLAPDPLVEVESRVDRMLFSRGLDRFGQHR